MANRFPDENEGLVYANIGTPAYQETVYTTPAQTQATTDKVEFLKNFRPEMVTAPWIAPDNYVAGRDPYWSGHANGMTFVDPIINRFIAVFDYEFQVRKLK